MSFPLLLCPPDHFCIAYEINPWMHREANADTEKARAQWRNLKETLERSGATIELIDPQPGLPDMVFTANAGLVRGRQFIPSSFFHKERQGEAPFFIDWFRGRGFEVISVPSGLAFEGEGDALYC